jgi:hypothetical protein
MTYIFDVREGYARTDFVSKSRFKSKILEFFPLASIMHIRTQKWRFYLRLIGISMETSPCFQRAGSLEASL